MTRKSAMLTGEVRVGIFALRDIPVGEEITYDYQFEHSGLAAAANAYRRAAYCNRITVDHFYGGKLSAAKHCLYTVGIAQVSRMCCCAVIPWLDKAGHAREVKCRWCSYSVSSSDACL